MGKCCMFRTCKNYSSSEESRGQGIKYYPIPKPRKNFEKCMRWLEAVNRNDITTHNEVKQHHYVCSKHFFGGNGPTKEFPDPIKDIQQHPAALDHTYSCHSEKHQLVKSSISEGTSKNQALESFIDLERTSTQNSTSVALSLAPVTSLETIDVEESSALELIEDSQFTKTVNCVIQTNKPPSASENIVTASSTTATFQGTEILPINQTKDVPPLKKLAQEFLKYHLENLDTCHWSVDVINESETGIPLNGIKCLKFRQSGNNNCLIRIEISQCLIPSVYFCNTLILPSHKLFSSSSVDFNTSVSCMAELKNILFEIENYQTCQGIQGELFVHYSDKHLDPAYVCTASQSIRSANCQKLFLGQFTNVCPSCRITKIVLQNRKRREKGKVLKRTNIRYMTKDGIKDNLRIVNKKNKALKKRNKALDLKVKKSFKNDGFFMTEEESESFEEIIAKNPFKTKSVFHKLLMREQMKLIRTKKSRPRKWHPAIVQWCISLKARSSSAYETMRQAFPLPSQRTLHNYSTDLTTKSGFNDTVLLEMRGKIDIDNLEEHQKYFSLVLDEIQIKQDLVFNSSTGELMGASDLNQFRNKVTELEKQIKGNEDGENINLANHVLQLMVRGLTTNFKYPYAFFPCGNLHAEDLYSIVWEAIENLQAAGFRILAVVCDKASSNMKFIKICTESVQKLKNHPVGYESKNPFNYGQPLYFVSDVCHNVKTAKNCLNNSGKMKKHKDGSVKPIRLLEKNGQRLLWKHIVDTYEIDSKSLLRLAPKLTYNHVYPNPHSCMKVKLATQIMSSTTANAVEELIGEEAKETVKFLRLFDTFFDILNISNTYAFFTKKKPALEPFKSVDDWRFKVTKILRVSQVSNQICILHKYYITCKLEETHGFFKETY